MKILLCGHRSFAAHGLDVALRDAGHTVHTFQRGAAEREYKHVFGPVEEIDTLQELDDTYDVLINYILIKDGGIDENLRYIDAVLRCCAARKIGHLVHISSISVHQASASLIREDSPVETLPERKGSYGALKVATENHLLAQAPEALRVTVVRPGFILGPGLLNPIVGMGLRLPNNRLLVLGHAGKQFPLITRELCNRSIVAMVERDGGPRDRFLLVNGHSPTRREYLEICAGRLGQGSAVHAAPVLLWKLAGLGGEAAKYVLGMQHLKPSRIVRNLCERQAFDASASEEKLRISFQFDWPEALCAAVGDQKPPPLPFSETPHNALGRQEITFIGFGAIVKQKHLPALKRLGHAGGLYAFDLAAGTDEDGREIRSVAEDALPDTELYTVATPGRVHHQAMVLLPDSRAPVLVEKPLCYGPNELQDWVDFDTGRHGGVYVCHNYRYKKNVVELLAFLARYNPGRLLHVNVNFQSPPVRNDSVSWRSREREAKTLLMDYGLHFLDVACMFDTENWQAGDIRFELDGNGDTGMIAGRLNGSYPVDFLLRQGFIPRRARIDFTFRNYRASIGFFPDTFVPHLSNDNPWLYRREAAASARATRTKIIDKLLRRDSDASHDRVYQAIFSENQKPHHLRVSRLAALYRGVFEIAARVYRAENE